MEAKEPGQSALPRSGQDVTTRTPSQPPTAAVPAESASDALGLATEGLGCLGCGKRAPGLDQAEGLELDAATSAIEGVVEGGGRDQAVRLPGGPW